MTTAGSDPSALTILVTGASGFIGTRLCRSLVAGNRVHAVSRRAGTWHHEHLHWQALDLTDLDATRRVVNEVGADVIFHLCSYPHGERDLSMVPRTLHGEVVPTVNVLVAAVEAGCRRLVTSGSMEEPLAGEAPASPYAAAKSASRGYARMFHLLYSLPVVGTRIFMTYGPGQASKYLIPHSIGQMLSGDVLRIASPERLVDWIYVDDVVHGLRVAATAPGLEGQSVDLGSGTTVAIRDLVEKLRRMVNPHAAVEFGTVPARVEQPRVADVATTTALTGWRPRVSLDAGLELTVQACYGSAGTPSHGHAHLPGRS